MQKTNEQLAAINDSLSELASSKSDETAQKTNEQLAAINDSLSEMAGNRKSDEAVQISEEEKKRAAYALNLCMVSVSQIIDYNDLIIMDQEYDAILNNLNLENMPKDDALLEIFKQILDTVTFFRIQESEKKFVDRRYQMKMKNAIWSAVPNISVMIGVKPTVSSILMLANTVGSAYMNYRRAKSEAKLDYDEEVWKLQTSAMEQINGLRRELFATAWRLAEKYEFNDKLRLTESQITNYNNILMDPNPYRRYERLKFIEGEFEAYPPFWYFKGHTALSIANANDDNNSYKEKAKNDFKKYFDIMKDENCLLREDEICASCALEYVQLLDNDDEKEKYIKKAADTSRTKNDILQLCAMAYLSIGKTEDANRLFRKLVCDGYNAETNLQILAVRYISGYLNGDDNKKSECKEEFDSLCKFSDIGEELTFPEKGENTDKIAQRFITEKRLSLLNRYRDLIINFYMSKSKEYRELGNSSNREADFVKFAENMQNELAEMEAKTGIEFGDLAEKVRENKDELKPWCANDKNSKQPDFDSVFGDFFVKASSSANVADDNDMKAISERETGLYEFSEKYSDKRNSFPEEGAPLSIDDFLDENSESEEIKNIKETIRKNLDNSDALIKDPEKAELLLSGTADYQKYIKNHKLSGDFVAAVLHQKKGDDLIFSLFGLTVKEVAAKKVARLIITPSPLKWLSLVHSLKANNSLIHYKDVKSNKNNNGLESPKFKSEYINFEVLKNICNDLAKESTVSKISENIEKKIRIIKNLPPDFDKKVTDMIDKFTNSEFTSLEDQSAAKKAIEAGQDWLDNYDYVAFEQMLSGILVITDCPSICETLNEIKEKLDGIIDGINKENE